MTEDASPVSGHQPRAGEIASAPSLRSGWLAMTLLLVLRCTHTTSHKDLILCRAGELASAPSLRSGCLAMTPLLVLACTHTDSNKSVIPFPASAVGAEATV